VWEEVWEGEREGGIVPLLYFRKGVDPPLPRTTKDREKRVRDGFWRKGTTYRTSKGHSSREEKKILCEGKPSDKKRGKKEKKQRLFQRITHSFWVASSKETASQGRESG